MKKVFQKCSNRGKELELLARSWYNGVMARSGKSIFVGSEKIQSPTAQSRRPEPEGPLALALLSGGELVPTPLCICCGKPRQESLVRGNLSFEAWMCMTRDCQEYGMCIYQPCPPRENVVYKAVVNEQLPLEAL